MHQKVPAWFGGKLRGKGPAHGRHLAAQLTLCRWRTGAQLELALLVGDERGQCEGVVLTFEDQMPAQLVEVKSTYPRLRAAW